MSDENADYSGPLHTCWYIEGDACPRCSSQMATNGTLDWCENEEVCGYSRPAADPVREDPEFDGAGLA